MIAAILQMTLGTCLSIGQAPAPAVVAEGPAAPPARRVAFSFMPGMTSGVSPVPSLDLAFFLGGRLPRRGWFLGYQFTFSSGLAERYAAGFFTHRHHLTGMRSFGRTGRGFVSVGGGVAVLAVYPVVEVEGRLGVRFGPRRRGVFGGVARLGWNIHYREQVPMPQLGLMFGVALL